MTLGAWAWFHPDFPCVSLPFADFVLYPFTIRNHIHEYNYMLRPVSPSESLNLGVVFGTLPQLNL